MKNKTWYVYILLDNRKVGSYKYSYYKFNYEPFYVGISSSKGTREYEHFKNSFIKNSKDSNIFKFKVIRKIYKEVNECYRVIYKKYNNKKYMTKVQATSLERKLIKVIGRRDLYLGPLTNLTEGGEGTLGYIYTLEDRKKIGNKSRGKKLSLESRKLISKNNARYWSGKKLTQEQKENFAKNLKKQFRYNTYECISPTGEIYIVDDGIGNFCKNHNLHRGKLSDVAHGKRKHHKNWKCTVIQTINDGYKNIRKNKKEN